VGVELFHADGQTDVTKLIVASHNFANSPKVFCARYALRLNKQLFIWVRSLFCLGYKLRLKEQLSNKH